MLEIYRVAVELMYSRRAKINIYAIKWSYGCFLPKKEIFFFYYSKVSGGTFHNILALTKFLWSSQSLKQN